MTGGRQTTARPQAPRNRTLQCDAAERAALAKNLTRLSAPVGAEGLVGRVVNQDLWEAFMYLPKNFVDLGIVDPPYNLTKDYNGHVFHAKEAAAYTKWFADLIERLIPTLRPNASLYVCSDWRTSTLVFPVLDARFHVRNRITWEREKGRGAKANWKNNTEDIWFCTRSRDYCFNLDEVKLKRRVLAPYRSEDGAPKDWREGPNGNYRLTHPSNLWSDITVPFWSMPENTAHPAQKPEKLIAKLVLASSAPGDFVFDPFLGSGTTAVVASKLGRRFCGVEINAEYCCWALKRLRRAQTDKAIQGYADGVFWERNSAAEQSGGRGNIGNRAKQRSLLVGER